MAPVRLLLSACLCGSVHSWPSWHGPAVSFASGEAVSKEVDVKQLMQEEQQLQEVLGRHDTDLEAIARLNDDQDRAIDDLGARVSRKSAEAEALKGRVAELSDDTSVMHEQPRMGQVELNSKSHEVISSLSKANAELRQKIEAQKKETKELENQLEDGSMSDYTLDNFYAGNDVIINEVKNFQDEEAQLTAELAKNLRLLGEKPEMQAKAVEHSISKSQYMQYYKLASTIPELARRLREKQYGVFQRVQEMQEKLNKLAETMPSP